MRLLLDTNIVIHLRDANEVISERLATSNELPVISLVTLIELKAGLVSDPDRREERLAGLKRIMRRFAVMALDQEVVQAYGVILEHAGYSRTRVLDRLIAATAIVHDLTLVTVNGRDFADIPDLNLKVWPAPTQ